MAELKVGTVIDQRKLSPMLEIFRMLPQSGDRFPDYVAGQYIALRRERCRLTKRAVGPDGLARYLPDLDESGQPKLGPVTHSYSIASAPFESREHGYLEFYVVLERDQYGTLGRLSSSFFEMRPPADDTVTYVNRITGNFTLDKRANGFGSVLLVGTGTGVAPFVSMVKQLHRESYLGGVSRVQYTLLHTNRTYEELAYHQELLEIEASQRFDFVYVASVSRPTERDITDSRMGRGRANNLLRHIFGMPAKEEEDVEALLASGGDSARAQAALARVVAPALPSHISRSDLLKRFGSSRTVLLTCGNPSSMEDIKYVADAHRIPFEKEDW
jgi:ferredoxin-NADP reductase